MNSPFLKKFHSNCFHIGDRGIALIIAVLCLAAISALAMAGLSSSGVEMAAARASAHSLARANCMDQVARYVMEQLDARTIMKVSDRVYSDDSSEPCNTMGVAWVNFDASLPNDDMNCISPFTRPPCVGADAIYTYPPGTPPDPDIECRTTRAIAMAAHTPFTPLGSIVGQQAGTDPQTDKRYFGVRIVVADLPVCSSRYLNHYIDISEVEAVIAGKGRGNVR
ncbi:MAG: hypothetical protein AB1405_00425 [Bdellovibrionota bacterium]